MCIRNNRRTCCCNCNIVNGNTVTSAEASVLIDTIPNAVPFTPTNLGESFNSESERLLRSGTPNAYTAWVPEDPLLSNATGYDYMSTLSPASPLSNSTGSMPDACVVGSYIIPPQKFFMTGISNKNYFLFSKTFSDGAYVF